MTNGKIVDTIVWIDYFDNTIDDRTNAVEELLNVDEVFLLPVI